MFLVVEATCTKVTSFFYNNEQNISMGLVWSNKSHFFRICPLKTLKSESPFTLLEHVTTMYNFLTGLVDRKWNQFANVDRSQRRCHLRFYGIPTDHFRIFGSDDQDLGSENRKLYLNSRLDVIWRTHRFVTWMFLLVSNFCLNFKWIIKVCSFI